MCLQERSWRYGLLLVELCVTEDGHQVVLRGLVLEDAEDDMIGKYVIQVRDAISGELTSQWKSPCQHKCAAYLASWSTNNTPYLAHSCWQCEAVYVYDISRGQLITQYKEEGVKPEAICRGPGPDTLLLVDVMQWRILQLQWTGDSLQLIKKIQHNHRSARPDICYSSLHDNIYLTGNRTVSCIPLSGGQTVRPLWQLGRWGVDVGGQQLDLLLSVCCGADRLYLGECNTDRLLVVDGERGELLHVQNGMSR